MKKIISTIIVFVCCCLPLTGFSAYKTCVIGSSSFCNCFIDNCKQTFPAAICTYSKLTGMINNGGGANSVCSQEVGTGTIKKDDKQQCVNAINVYLNDSACK